MTVVTRWISVGKPVKMDYWLAYRQTVCIGTIDNNHPAGSKGKAHKIINTSDVEDLHKANVLARA